MVLKPDNFKPQSLGGGRYRVPYYNNGRLFHIAVWQGKPAFIVEDRKAYDARALPWYLNHSSLALLDKNAPKGFFGAVKSAQGKPQIASNAMGLAAHLLLLEGEYEFQQGTLLLSSETDTGNPTAAGLRDADAASKVAVTASTVAAIRAIRDAMYDTPMRTDIPGFSYYGSVGAFMEECVREITVISVFGKTLVKCRLDAWHEPTRTIVDLKTVDEYTPDAFHRLCQMNKWFRQAAFYSDAAGAERFLFLPAKYKPAQAVDVLPAPANDIWRGREDYQRLVALYADCLATNAWPGFTQLPLSGKWTADEQALPVETETIGGMAFEVL